MEFDGAVSSEKEQQQGASYTYWVRKITEDAAHLPVPQKLTPEAVRSSKSQPATLGSVWNRVRAYTTKNHLLIYFNAFNSTPFFFIQNFFLPNQWLILYFAVKYSMLFILSRDYRLTN